MHNAVQIAVTVLLVVPVVALVAAWAAGFLRGVPQAIEEIARHPDGDGPR